MGYTQRKCKYCGQMANNLYVHWFSPECLKNQPEEDRKKHLEREQEFKRRMREYMLKRYHTKNDNAELIYCEKCRVYIKPASKKAHERTLKHTSGREAPQEQSVSS